MMFACIAAQGSPVLKKAIVAVAALSCLSLAACGSSSELAGNVISGGKGPIEVNPDAFSTPVYCPPIQLQTNTYLIMKYERGRDNEPEGLLYQATLSDWARSCTKDSTDQTRIKLGLSGSVTPGPAWKGGEVVLPIRVAVITGAGDEKPLISELLTVPVTIGAGAPAENWTLIEDKFVVPRDQEMKVVFGFDEGRRR
ncbi:hypothetical protein JM93_02200 [Roseibium hamelinense]|uniref:Lipoprotein n=2 Tax=Roseibium hamelinense TaxID=150831 RepID=A0A562T2I2_9HYPH|nr:hypothetical protein [Roseibium hamelinense]TWI87633.1 hypothetical protein JM93_02200 [Roseibium hamelinense]